MQSDSPLSRIDTAIAEAMRRIKEEQQRLDELSVLRGLMEKHAQHVFGPSRVDAASLQTAMLAFGPTGKSKRERIILTAQEILNDGRRRISRELVRELGERGVVVGGSDDAGLLATYLSREKDLFVSDVRAGGWTLRRLTKRVRPDEVTASSGLVLNG